MCGVVQSGAIRLLIATDVAARGLDIDDVEVVINYSFPLVRMLEVVSCVLHRVEVWMPQLMQHPHY